jgi:hypothetical protein
MDPVDPKMAIFLFSTIKFWCKEKEETATFADNGKND